MFLKAQRLSVNYYRDNKAGTVMAWFTNDLETIEEFFGWGTIMLVDAVFLTSLTMFKMINTQWQLTLILLIPMLLIVIWGLLVEKFMSLRWEYRQKVYDELYDFSQESFTGIRVIKAFVKETQELHAFAKVAKKYKDVNIGFVRISVIFDIVISVVISGISALILGFGGYIAYCAINSNPIVLFNAPVKMDAGLFIEYFGYFEILIWPLMALGQVVSMYSRASGSMKRITRFLDTPEDISNPKDAIVLNECFGKITFNNFSFAYPNKDKNALNNISFTINEGERVGIVGKIGCGKTTLVNVLLRLYNVENNQILIDDKDIMSLDIQSLRDHVAYVPQDNFLYSTSIKENVSFADENKLMDEIIDATKFANVHDDISQFPEGYDTITGERGVTLSGGQKQRISIARAFIKNAPILILDDSVSAVDVKTEESILKNINEYRKGKTTIVIASRISTVSHLDKVVVLSNGCLEAFDTPENLLKISPTYQRMATLQMLEKEVEGGN
jgi:ATP-binding cassette subfamily B protein